jgi:hypothetical protein
MHQFYCFVAYCVITKITIFSLPNNKTFRFVHKNLIMYTNSLPRISNLYEEIKNLFNRKRWRIRVKISDRTMQYSVKLDLNVKETLSSCLLGHKLRCPKSVVQVTLLKSTEQSSQSMFQRTRYVRGTWK